MRALIDPQHPIEFAVFVLQCVGTLFLAAVSK